MIRVTQNFEMLYRAHKAMVIYGSIADEAETYVEAYDITVNGKPQNAHPLSREESIAFAQSLSDTAELSSGYLQSKGLCPENLLYTRLGMEGFALWFTPAQRVGLHFSQTLGIPSAQACVPALLWKASKEKLHIYALKMNGRLHPDLDTPLYHAPFFNVYKHGSVCMGTVKLAFAEGIFLEEFMRLWESYFFNSHFSHLMSGHNPVSTNMVSLWKSLCRKSLAFPENVLKLNGKRLRSLLS